MLAGWKTSDNRNKFLAIDLQEEEKEEEEDLDDNQRDFLHGYNREVETVHLLAQITAEVCLY
jgi:hypothetical protein